MSPDDTNRAKLARLADAIIEDIMATPDADIVAEVGSASIERARTIILEVKANLSRRALADAKAQLDAWRSARSHATNTRTAARDRFEKIRQADSAFNQQMTIAARKGRDPTENDIEGLAEDWDDLQRLDEQDALE